MAKLDSAARSGTSVNLSTIVFVIGLIVLALAIIPTWSAARYAMIGWDTCSRIDQTPLMFECHPGAGDPEMLETCTGREMGLAIANTREWTQQVQDCRTPKLFGGMLDRAEPDEETIEEDQDNGTISEPT